MADNRNGPFPATDRSPAAEVSGSRHTRRNAIGSAVRVTIVTSVLIALYLVAPLDETFDATVAIQLTLALLVLAVVVTVQVIAVARAIPAFAWR